MGQLLDELLRDVGIKPPAGGTNPQIEAVTSDSLDLCTEKNSVLNQIFILNIS